MGTGAPEQDDLAVLAKGGRANVLGFMLRLGARIPFLLVAPAYFDGTLTMGTIFQASNAFAQVQTAQIGRASCRERV